MAQGDLRQALEKRKEITITVKGRRTGNAISLPVWFAVEGETLSLLPVGGTKSQWFRNVRADPTMTVRAGRSQATSTARVVTGAPAVQAIMQKFRSKYGAADVARYYPGQDVALQLRI